MPVTRPNSLSTAEVEAATDILVEAFWPDVAMQAMAAFDKGVLRFMMGKRLEAALKLNTVFIYRVDPVDGQAGRTGQTGLEAGGGEVLGVLTINPPGLDMTEVRKSYATDQPFMDHISKDTKDWLNNEYYPWFTKWSNETFGPSGLGDSLYINLVAVRSDHRRRGIGKKLMREAMALAEKEGVDVTLLSHEEENTTYYQSLGFKSLGYATLDIRGQETRWWGMQLARASA